jgi:hypothetical protein
MRHLRGFVGILQVDGYAGYKALAERKAVSLAFCWAHVGVSPPGGTRLPAFDGPPVGSASRRPPKAKPTLNRNHQPKGGGSSS